MASRARHALFVCAWHSVPVHAWRNAGRCAWRGSRTAEQENWNGLHPSWRKYQGPSGGAAGCGTLSRSTEPHQRERTASGDFGQIDAIGLDLSADLCFEHLNTIIERAEKDSIVWVDM